jgi:hypothetical protein
VSYAGVLLAGVAATHGREGILETRYWSRSELERTAERVFPEDLAARLAAISNLSPSRSR